MRTRLGALLVIAMMASAGCSSKSAVTSSDSDAGQGSSLQGSASGASRGYGFDEYQTGPIGDVFFDYDSSILAAEAQQRLTENASWMKSNSARQVIIEGHCDDRGTSEYNIALGERRAISAKEFMVRLGVAASRLETITYGEERPFDKGQNEEAWAKNRRAHFIVK
ncbi:MAG: peptidoglycan-associated lipoprotein Pal [Chlorobium sp.]|uniref:peptidoglycan-associated lipoprotein Pal n=1 Tax=Chlorobium sp. TaxID=1095 RepID=UPI0025C1663E|nr:peptidoglycan-associated lipoprotein Pal [Chlorobium sp.]MCF8382144.1 peptidoglycan-associated lipoprotein Pal [Chlorobium sp.]